MTKSTIKVETRKVPIWQRTSSLDNKKQTFKLRDLDASPAKPLTKSRSKLVKVSPTRYDDNQIQHLYDMGKRWF